MTTTRTLTATFTITHARYVTSKIKTDLKLLQKAYGDPTDLRINDFGEEAALLLRDGYLGEVTYGYRRNGNWILALRYVGQSDGTLEADDRAGKVPRGVDVSGAGFYSYLIYSQAWYKLSQDKQQTLEQTLPIKRTPGEPLGTNGGYWTTDRTYSSNGIGVARSTFQLL